MKAKTNKEKWYKAILSKLTGAQASVPEARNTEQQWLQAIYEAAGGGIDPTQPTTFSATATFTEGAVFDKQVTTWNLQVNNYFQTGGVVGTIYVKAPRVEAAEVLVVGEIDVATELAALRAEIEALKTPAN